MRLHLLIDGERDLLPPSTLIIDYLEELPNRLGMTKISTPQVVRHISEKKEIITGFVLIAESHIKVEAVQKIQGYVKLFIDIFTCKKINIKEVVAYTQKVFDYRNIATEVINRGLEYQENE